MGTKIELLLWGLRSAGCGDLTMLTTAAELRKWSFCVAAPVIWNTLPAHLRSPATSKGQFWCGLKSHVFQQARSCVMSVSDWTGLDWTSAIKFT